jgi:single-strand DNA-binding protein
MSVNKAILVGNVGKDPEVRYLDKNVAVARFPLATSDPAYKTASGLDVPERTEWHNIVAWRGLAELAEKYIKKGSQLYIEGKIQTRSWEKDGVKRYSTEITAETIQFLGRRNDGQESQGGVAPQAASAAAPQAFDAPTSDAPDDDLPF